MIDNTETVFTHGICSVVAIFRAVVRIFPVVCETALLTVPQWSHWRQRNGFEFGQRIDDLLVVIGDRPLRLAGERDVAAERRELGVEHGWRV
jgi:hypothetical protein